MPEYKASKERLVAHIRTLAELTSTPGKGCTRLSFSTEYRKAAHYLTKEMEALDLQVSVDPVGNIRGRLAGTQPELPPLLTGSHIDSVFNGGNYDGVVGVVCALEALAVLRKTGFLPERSIELIIFVEEEGPNFGSPLTGSKALVGQYDTEKLKDLINREGISFYQAAREYGLDPDSMSAALLAPGDVYGMIEVHVEQSIVLDSQQIPLGLVTGIAGMRWVKVGLTGTANHAGATPMNFRSDPLAGAAEIISEVEKTARFSAGQRTVATVGRIDCQPNAPNIIPESVELTVDVRDSETAGIETVISRLSAKTEELASRRGLSVAIEERKVADPTPCSPLIVDALKAAADDCGYPYLEMMSGALHDAAIMASIAPTGMLFLPSIDGRSHVPEERTEIEDITKGCDVLIGALKALTAQR